MSDVLRGCLEETAAMEFRLFSVLAKRFTALKERILKCPSLCEVAQCKMTAIELT